MNFKKINFQLFFNLAVFVLLFFTGIFLFSDHFKFGLNQDITRVLFYNKLYLSSINIHTITHFIQPYSGQYLLIFFLNLLFGFEAQWYFVTSLVLRTVAAFSIYLLGKSVFKNKFMGLAASLLFIVSYAGVQTSLPVCSSTYLSIAFMNFGLIYLYRYIQESSKRVVDKILLKSYCWIFLAFILSPFSMHGLIFLLPVTLIGAAVLKVNKLSYSLIQIMLFFALIFLIKRVGFLDSAGTAREVAGSLLNISYFLKIPNLAITLLSPLASFYQMIFIPEFNPIISLLNLNNPSAFFLLSVIPFFIFIPLIVWNKSNRLKLSVLSFFWLLFAYILQTVFTTSLLRGREAVLFGGLISFLILTSAALLSRAEKCKVLLSITLLAWPFSFSIIPHLAYPGIPQETTTRYFTVSVAGICLLVVFIVVRGISLLVKKIGKKFDITHNNQQLVQLSILLVIFGTIFIGNFGMVKAYLKSEGEKGNYRKYIDSSFEIMNNEIGNRSKKKRPIVFIEVDKNDFTFAFVSVIDAGGERFSILNNNLSENVMPFFIASQEQLIAIFCNNENKNFNPYNLKPGVEDLFAFKEDNKKIYVETAKAREDILRISKNPKTCPNPIILSKNGQR